MPFSFLPPVVSAKLVQDLLQFYFVADSVDDLQSGLQPFAITDDSEEQQRDNLSLSRLYGALYSSEHGIMLADAETLNKKEVCAIPLNYYELEKTLGIFGNLLGVVLGPQHTLTTVYCAFWDTLTKGLCNELQIIIDTQYYIKPVHILRSVQLVCYEWFTHKKARLSPFPPDFAQLLRHIRLQTYMLPRLPSTLHALLHPRNPKLTPTVTPTLATASLTPLNSSDSSVVSGLTQGTGSRTAIWGSFQANLHPDMELQQLVPSTLKLNDIIGTSTPPLMDDNTPMCLAFQVRHGCWSNCKRVDNHGKALSPAEKQRLTLYLQTQTAHLTPPPPVAAVTTHVSGTSASVPP